MMDRYKNICIIMDQFYQNIEDNINTESKENINKLLKIVSYYIQRSLKPSILSVKDYEDMQNMYNKKCIYCTDTNTLDGIKAKNYDYYFIEANFEEEEMKERIKAKELLGQYAYEKDAILNHLSKEKCDAWLFENVGDNSQYFYMHRHEEKEKEYGKQQWGNWFFWTFNNCIYNFKIM